MRITGRVPAAVALLGALLIAPAAASAHPNHPSPVVGYVYVNDNTAPANTIAGFARHADGTLSALPGSPFATGGAGTGPGIGSQGSLQSTRHGRYLLAVDAGSNQLSVLRVRHDGSLELARGGVVSSGGNEPVSIAIYHRLVYVANAGTGASDYTGFVLGRRGRLDRAARLDGGAARQRHARRRAVQRRRHPAGRHPGRHLADRQLRGRPRRPADGRGRARRSRLRARDRSAASFAPPTPPSCTSQTLTAAPRRAPCRRSATASGYPDLDRRLRRSPISRRLPAGSRSATTDASCSRSTPRSPASRATRSGPTARWRCSAARRSRTRSASARSTPG